MFNPSLGEGHSQMEVVGMCGKDPGTRRMHGSTGKKIIKITSLVTLTPIAEIELLIINRPVNKHVQNIHFH